MTVSLVIVSHSARLAEGVVELAGQMSQGKTPIVAAGGAGVGVIGTSAEIIMAAIQSVSGPDGVLVLLDLGSALLSTEMALEFLEEEERGRVALTYAPLVEGAIAAALEASLGHTLAEVKGAAERAANAQQLLLLKPLEQGAQEEQAMSALPHPTGAMNGAPTVVEGEAPPVVEEGVVEAELVIHNATGLHARPASLFVQEAGRFGAHIEVRYHGRRVEAKSIFGVLSLNVRKGNTITLRASGKDAAEAVEALKALARADFYEMAPAGDKSAAIGQPQVEGHESSGSAGPHMGQMPAQVQEERRREVWKGIPTSPGVAIGPALVYAVGAVTLDEVQAQPISGQQVEQEQERLRSALAAAIGELHELAARVERDIGKEEAGIFGAQAMMLDDPLLLETALEMIAKQHIDAAGALAAAGEQLAGMLAALDSTLLAARAVDVRDAVGRALGHLGVTETTPLALSALEHPVILVAANLTPSDTASLKAEMVLGICTVQGGPTAHASILARALGIPAIAGIHETVLQGVHTGDELGLDAVAGLLYHLPAPDVAARLEQRVAEQRRQRAVLKEAAQQAQPSLTMQGRRIHLLANVGSEAEAEAARAWGAGGIGLLRTEFLFATASVFPDENEQRQRYAYIFCAFGDSIDAPTGKPVVVRTLDAGADKPMPALEAVIGRMQEDNPALGKRGVRISLAHLELFEQQLRALLLAAGETGTKLHIMFPMVATVEELRLARALFERVHAQLVANHAAVPAHVPIGIMVEVPSSVALASELAQLADFFSIGANDLLQYTVASDRTNAAVAALYNPMQPALLRFIAQVAEAGRRAGKPVAVCGEMASDTRLAPVLIALGVDELSMTPTALPAVRQVLTRLPTEALEKLARRVLQAQTVSEVEQACKEIEER